MSKTVEQLKEEWKKAAAYLATSGGAAAYSAFRDYYKKSNEERELHRTKEGV